VPFTYQSGEDIRKGDRVLFHDEPTEIEFFVDKLIGDPAMDWYLTEMGGGVMVNAPGSFGHVFLNQPDVSEDLVFVARAEDGCDGSLVRPEQPKV
jgi:hypothetical protein